MKIEFKNVVVTYAGCGCCGEGQTIKSEGPFVIETQNVEYSIDEHAKFAFGNVQSYEYNIIEE